LRRSWLPQRPPPTTGAPPTADHSLKDLVGTQAKDYATDVTSVVIANSGHWIYEEHPDEMTQRLFTFFK
jgi:pimeloyl-ACP methyl ester carboxylesterase